MRPFTVNRRRSALRPLNLPHRFAQLPSPIPRLGPRRNYGARQNECEAHHLYHEFGRQPGSNPARTTLWGAITRTRMRLRASFSARSTAARLFGAKRSA